MPSRRSLLAAGALALAGCSSLTGLLKVEQPATIILVRDVAAIIAPDTVASGAAFDIRFASFENICTDSERDESSVRGDSILIRSFVRRQTQCGDALVMMPHVFRLQLDRRGQYRIYLSGRMDRAPRIIDTVITRDLVVR